MVVPAAMQQAVRRALKVVPVYGRQVITTVESVRLVQRHGVHAFLDDLPAKYAAVLSPLEVGGLRFLALARHVPRLARKLVYLHEAGHLYQRTADFGITYDAHDWQRPAEAAADAFAAIGLIPTWHVDLALSASIWRRDVEDDVAEQLVGAAEGMWDPERALSVARDRLYIREELGI